MRRTSDGQIDFIQAQDGVGAGTSFYTLHSAISYPSILDGNNSAFSNPVDNLGYMMAGLISIATTAGGTHQGRLLKRTSYRTCKAWATSTQVGFIWANQKAADFRALP